MAEIDEKKRAKCPYCGRYFMIASTDCVQIIYKKNKRYAHRECALKNEVYATPEDKNLANLLDYVSSLFQEQYDDSLVRKQIKEYERTYDYSYDGMRKTLEYYYTIKKGDIKKAKGIGIIPYVYKEAQTYYFEIWKAQQRNKHLTEEKYQAPKEEIKIKAPERKVKSLNLFSFLDEEDDNE